jgi:hypothetical protein
VGHFLIEGGEEFDSDECDRCRSDVVLKKFFVVAVLMMFATLGGCAKPKQTLVVMVGGLGFSQLGDVRRAVQDKCPDADVINAGAIDGYKADLPRLVNGKPHQKVIFVGHSFGCAAIASAAPEVQPIDLAVFIDPAWNDFRLPESVKGYMWFKRGGIGIERTANIVGASNPKVIAGGHNDIPHSDELIAGIVDAINKVNAAPPPKQFKQPKSTEPPKPQVLKVAAK